MPYADPTRSPYCAARHLLRHLTDAKALRRNPLVVSAANRELDDAEIVHVAQSLVRRAFDDFEVFSSAVRPRKRARHAAILLRCDVLGESRADIARDLGLSLPQFERERRTAMARLLCCLQGSRGERPSVQAVHSDLARTVLDRALRVADSGDRQSALSLLENVVRSAPPKERIDALIRMSEIEGADHCVIRSRAALDGAASLLAAPGISADDECALWLLHEAASLRLQSLIEGPSCAARSLRVREDLPRRSESIALLLAQAETLDGCGMVQACRPFVLRAIDLLADTPEIDPVMRVDLAFLQAQMSFWLNPSAKGRTGLEDAITDARAHGYAGRADFAELSMLGGRWVGNDDRRARREYRALLSRIVQRNETPRQTRFFASWDAADIECGIGEPWRAAEAARNALVLAPNSQRALLMKALLARAYARGGRLDLSERIAREIIEHPGSSRAGMALLSAKRTLAYLTCAAGRAKETWEHLRDAAELAAHYGTARVEEQIGEQLAEFKRRRKPSISITFKTNAARG